MAKMRVHELAKELGIENKQIIEFLSTTEHAVKSHSSSIEDDVQKMVRDKFQKKAAPKAETAPKAENAPKKEAAPKAETAPKTEAASKAAEGTDGRPERPKKKSSITAVFNPQYSKQGGGRRPQGDRDRRPMNGDRRPQGDRDRRPGANGDRRPMNGDRRPQGDRDRRPGQNGYGNRGGNNILGRLCAVHHSWFLSRRKTWRKRWSGRQKRRPWRQWLPRWQPVRQTGS